MSEATRQSICLHWQLTHDSRNRTHTAVSGVTQSRDHNFRVSKNSRRREAKRRKLAFAGGISPLRQFVFFPMFA